MARRSNYSEEFREQAVRRVFEWRETRSVELGGVKHIAAELGVNPETLRTWVRRVEIDTGQRKGTTTQEKARLRKLERENRHLRRANEILKAASAFSLRALDPRPSSSSPSSTNTGTTSGSSRSAGN